MDPFSLATGVAGLVSLAAQIASALAAFHSARKSYARLTSELGAMSSTLCMLQAHVDKGINARAAALLREPVDQCRQTLEKLRAEFASDQRMLSLRPRLAWAKSDERRVIDFIGMLERYKTMFNLALQIDLSGQVDTLQCSISQLLVSKESNHLNAVAANDEKGLRKIVDWLKPLDMETSLHSILQLRQPGTCQWVLEHQIFAAWKESSSGSFLWLSGIPGNGKTVISSVLVEHLVQEQGPEEAVLYAFCDFRNPKSVDPVVILRTFLSELLLAYPCSITDDFPDLVGAENKKRQPPQTVPRLVLLIRKAAQRFRRTWIVIDGLDECDKRWPLLQFLPTLVAEDTFNVFVASRPEQDIREAFHSASVISLQTELLHVHDDIIHHVKCEIARRPQLFRLSVELKGTICEAISKADGMFRLVQCQLDLLVRQRTQKSLIRILHNLPTTLWETYDHIMQRIDDAGHETAEIARRALRWIVDVQWPIRLKQVAEAIMIEPQGKFNPDYLLTSSAVIVEVLSSLVTHNTEDDSVYLSHFSVLEYLISVYLSDSAFSRYHLPEPAVLRMEMAALLLDYMLIDDFNRPLFEREEELHRFLDEEHPFYQYAVHCWVHYLPAVDTSTSDAIQALSRFLQASKTRGAAHNLRQQVWFTHIKGFNHDPGIYYHPMRWVMLHCTHPSVITYLPQLDLPAELIQCCLFASLWVRHTPATEVLLDVGGADVDAEHICAPCTQMMSYELPTARSPLAFALERGNIAGARALLERGANARAVMADGWTALHSAAKSGLLEGVQLLLQQPLGVDVEICDTSGQTAYMIATQLGTDTIVQCLVHHGAAEELELDQHKLESLLPPTYTSLGCTSSILVSTLF
ncbi:ANK-REP-REGION domain-containing protein [Mycena venus]|uniref:ANK-REP-REGION domain-containing protein n=1 Tax=Mycena venus TaxID=2733690 RepID=A0A8H7CR31_9AGAR|nr:ANK-REP-REGION domain-containing protein [Mycena venus]